MEGIDILLVEDNPTSFGLILPAYKKSQISNGVHVSRDGAEALNFIFCKGRYSERRIEDHPKVILLDLKIPLVNGLEILQRIKADPRTRAIPVVALVSSREDPDINQSYQLGANSFITKPVDIERFNECVNNLGLYQLLLNQSPASPSVQ